MSILVLLLACGPAPATPPAAPPGAEVHPPDPTDAKYLAIPREPKAAPDPVQGVVRSKMGELKACYEAEQRKVTAVAGKIEVGWSVNAGVVSKVHVISNETGDAVLATCITDHVARWSFAPDFSGDVQWPFVFQAPP